MADPRRPRLWHYWIVQTFSNAQWGLQGYQLPCTYAAVRMAKVLEPEPEYWRFRPMVVVISSWLINWALSFGELALMKRGKLSPSIYLGSSVLKSIQPTYVLMKYGSLVTGRQSTTNWMEVITAMFWILPFWGSLGYALYLLFLSIRDRHRPRMTIPIEQTPCSNPLARVNTAENLNVTAPILWKLVCWLNTPGPSLGFFAQPGALALNHIIFHIRCLITALPLMFLIPFSPKLPGEPKITMTANDPKGLESWKYLRPCSHDPCDGLATEIPLSSTAEYDEESTTGAASLRLAWSLPGSGQTQHSSREHGRLLSERLLAPSFLCFLDDANTAPDRAGYVTRKIENSHQMFVDVSYVFVSYTRRQFFTQIPNDPSLSAADRVSFQAAAERDKAYLVQIAIAAARDAGVPAFWIDFECIRPQEDDTETSDIEEVYHICDIVRASHSMTIALAPTLNVEKEHATDTAKHQWLLDWGSRLWTVPEALLCPSEHRIAVYTLGSATPEKMAKRNLSARVWDDAGALRQLMDHYEASLHLTQLELVTIAFECLQRRQTEKRHAGDVVYALMGLLRLRPKVDKSDTDFQAFARLSLANDNDQLLERLICLSSTTAHSPWHDLSDAWDTKLWQIHPHCQIADVEHGNAVVIGNTFGARIDWTSLHPVDFELSRRYTLHWVPIRSVMRANLYKYLLYFGLLFPIVVVLPGLSYSERQWWQTLLYQYIRSRSLSSMLFLLGAIASLSPAFLVRQYRQRPLTIQARFFGIQGRGNRGQVERYLFGADCGRLRWSTDRVVEMPCSSEVESLRQTFTLVDTLSLTATTFRAEHPPDMLFVGGSEHGLLRAVLCSCDPSTMTHKKEFVLRLEGSTLARMHPLDRFRFSLDPTPGPRTLEQ